MSENKVDQKEIEKVQKLLSDEEFVKKLVSQETVEDAKKLFEDQGIATSIEEMEMLGRFIKKISQKGNEKLSEEDLEEIVGGGKLKNAAIRTGGTVIGAICGSLMGFSGGGLLGMASTAIGSQLESIYDKSILQSEGAPVKNIYSKYDFVDSMSYNQLGGSVICTIGGTIAGAVAGYKISGKWCDKIK